MPGVAVLGHNDDVLACAAATFIAPAAGLVLAIVGGVVLTGGNVAFQLSDPVTAIISRASSGSYLSERPLRRDFSTTTLHRALSER